MNSMLKRAFSASHSGSMNPSRSFALLHDFFVGPKTVSGERVNHDVAMTDSGWYACQRNISEDIGKIPINVFRRTLDGKEKVIDHPVFKIVHVLPNPETTTISFWETMESWALGWGNGYAEITRDDFGQAREMWLRHPSRVTPRRDDDGNLVYDIRSDPHASFNPNNPKDVTLDADDVFHLHGLGGDGLVGFSILRIAAESLGLSISLQKFGSSFFGNGAKFSGVITIPESMGPKALQNVKESMNEEHTDDASRKNKFAIFEEGMKWQPTSIPPNESQFLESRAFSVTEMARFFRCPLHKIQHFLNGNGDGDNEDYVEDTLTPWGLRIDQEIQRKLFLKKDQLEFFAEHNYMSLLRGKPGERVEVLRKKFMMGTITPNEIRSLENMNRSDQEGSDKLWVQGAMIPIERAATGQGFAPNTGMANDQSGHEDLRPNDNDDEEERAETLRIFIDSERAIVSSQIEKLIHKESLAVKLWVKKCAGDQKSFEAWMEDFYGKQETFMMDCLQPILDATMQYASATGIELSPIVMLGGLRGYIKKQLEMGKTYALKAFRSGDPSLLRSLGDDYLSVLTDQFIDMLTKSFDNPTE